MQKPLSLRKYLETMARSLPIYKCLVNKDWKEVQMANVVVMRRHVNGHVTAGGYLVDLLCLGVKDTLYYFNESEREIEEMLGMAPGHFVEVDYALAHNIIYAGHDYAMDFDIHPHKDFALTRFILEEDDENIPLIEVPTGTEDGKPHLMVHQHGEFAGALAKLKKHAAEGNYYYTVGEEEGWDDEEEVEELLLDEIPVGELDFDDVQLVPTEDLEDKEKTGRRTLLEQAIIHTEMLLRLLPDEYTSLDAEGEQLWGKEMLRLEQSADLPNHVNGDQYEECQRVLGQVAALAPASEKTGEEAELIKGGVLELLRGHASNPLLVLSCYNGLLSLLFEEVKHEAKMYAERLVDQYPLVRLGLALGALVEGAPEDGFETIYQHKQIQEALPGYEQFAAEELFEFWLIRLWLSLQEGKPREALSYFHLLRDANAHSWHMMPVFFRFSEVLLNDFLNKVPKE